MTKRVFFLGAGFSKAINHVYPLMVQLTHNIGAELTKSSVAQHYDEIAPSIKGNIESLLTYLSTDYPWKTDTTRYANRALYEEILKLISQKFSDLAKDSIQYPSASDIGCRLAEYVATHLDECNFITLNYDLLLETTLLGKLEEINKALSFSDFYKYPMAWIGSRNHHAALGFTSYEREHKTIVPAILKLHGSANWFWAGINPSDTIYYRNWNRNEKDNIDMGLKPYIIPPVMDKNAFYSHIAIHVLWQQAENLLKEADEIYIIGFSFPQTDLSVRYLFQSSLRHSTAKIYVINSDTEQNLQVNYGQVFDENSNIDNLLKIKEICKICNKYISSSCSFNCRNKWS